MAMGQNLCLHFGADEHPCTTYFDVHQGYRVLTYSRMCFSFSPSCSSLELRIDISAMASVQQMMGAIDQGLQARGWSLRQLQM